MKKAAKKAAKADSRKGGRKASGTGRGASKPRRDPPMRAEYDFSNGVRGKYAKRFAAGSNVVVLEPEVARAFPTAKAVNAALRTLAQGTGKRGPATKRRTA